MNIRMNAGYIITDSIHIGKAEFVLGVNEKAPSPYVTWECKDGSNYFWGHYCNTLFGAQKDLCDRATREIHILEPEQPTAEDKTIKPKNKERER